MFSTYVKAANTAARKKKSISTKTRTKKSAVRSALPTILRHLGIKEKKRADSATTVKVVVFELCPLIKSSPPPGVRAVVLLLKVCGETPRVRQHLGILCLLETRNGKKKKITPGFSISSSSSAAWRSPLVMHVYSAALWSKYVFLLSPRGPAASLPRRRTRQTWEIWFCRLRAHLETCWKGNNRHTAWARTDGPIGPSVVHEFRTYNEDSSCLSSSCSFSLWLVILRSCQPRILD